ncbi:MAG: sigma-54 dependent transcriptional regulator [Deltaproteobacteria bacterium]|nr:sigma-54 dependent transcriptional regulator [Deltaproteobacteria bacterium]
MPNVLIVDDERNYLFVLEDLLTDEGYNVFTASSGTEALELLRDQQIDTILSDIKMPGMNGIELLERVFASDPGLPVILMTAFAEVDQAVSAMKKGAVDHIQKPFDNDDIKRAVARAIQKRSLDKNLRRIDSTQYDPVWGAIIGESEAMDRVFHIVKRVADTSATVLISGESGTGKEVIAKALHKASSRASKAFVSINCAAIPETLLESELFGYEKGAFTGAVSTKQGKFEIADSGVLFLDEIGEMSLNLQVKLLRVLQEQEFQRVGGNRDIRVDVRLVAATNKDLRTQVDAGLFRSDLFFRLNVVHVPMPPLRERMTDIPLLITYFLKKFCTRLGRQMLEIQPETMRVLCSYSWPGNVRELENAIEYAILMSRGHSITVEDLPNQIRSHKAPDSNVELNLEKNTGLMDALDAMEEKMIRDALRKAGAIQAQAAKILGISRSNLQYKMKKYGLLQ